MLTPTNSVRLTRIGVFYDGNYFYHVSNYYSYSHPRKSRISISGLHEFIRSQVAEHESIPLSMSHIVDAHYFRGRLSAKDASQKNNQLYYDRVFDDILMSEGVITHYLPVKSTHFGFKQEKRIDVWLALEAFELTLFKKFDVLVMIASDGDYVPLARKLNALGTRVMILSWDFEYKDENDVLKATKTSQELLEAVSYPIAMHEIIENRIKRNEPFIERLFVPNNRETTKREITSHYVTPLSPETQKSQVLSLHNGYGFIKYAPNNLYFHHSNVENIDFNDLMQNDTIEFKIAMNEKGQEVAIEVNLIEDSQIE